MLEIDQGSQLSYPQPVTFSYQRGERFQSLVDTGFAENLLKSNFCWLACYDMVASTYLTDEVKRKELIDKIATEAKEAGYLTENSGRSLPEREIEEAHLRSVSREFQAAGIPLEISTVDITSPQDIINQLENGNMLILGVDAEGGHAILMDKLYKDKQEQEAVMSFWDPAVPFPEIAHSFMPTTQTMFLLYNGQEHFPVIVGKNAHVIKRVPLPNGS